jgi:hypothetical protein
VVIPYLGVHTTIYSFKTNCSHGVVRVKCTRWVHWWLTRSILVGKQEGRRSGCGGGGGGGAMGWRVGGGGGGWRWWWWW